MEIGKPSTVLDVSPFASVPPDRWVAQNGLAFALRDRHPVSPGHTLVITRRMIATWWEATAVEQSAVMDLVADVKRQLDDEFAPHGYNVGFNTGDAAGQTVAHLHVHVIPRYHGDVADPRGGVRHVIPRLANYLAPLSIRDTSPQLLVTPFDGRLYLELVRCLLNDSFDRIDLLHRHERPLDETAPGLSLERDLEGLEDDARARIEPLDPLEHLVVVVPDQVGVIRLSDRPHEQRVVGVVPATEQERVAVVFPIHRFSGRHAVGEVGDEDATLRPRAVDEEGLVVTQTAEITGELCIIGVVPAAEHLGIAIALEITRFCGRRTAREISHQRMAACLQR